MVILGDALTGNVSPLLALVSLCTAALGIGGLVYEVRQHRRHHGRAHGTPGVEPDTEPATTG